MIEEWKWIRGFEAVYAISTKGRVWSTRTKQLIKPGNNGKYLCTRLKYQGATTRLYLHRAVAIAFIPTEDESLDVHHKNDIKTDNDVSNLEWLSRSKNIQDAYNKGLNYTPPTGRQVVGIIDGVEVEFINAVRASTYIGNKIGSDKFHSIRTGINQCCTGLNKTAYGYKWKYKEEQNDTR